MANGKATMPHAAVKASAAAVLAAAQAVASQQVAPVALATSTHQPKALPHAADQAQALEGKSKASAASKKGAALSNANNAALALPQEAAILQVSPLVAVAALAHHQAEHALQPRLAANGADKPEIVSWRAVAAPCRKPDTQKKGLLLQAVLFHLLMIMSLIRYRYTEQNQISLKPVFPCCDKQVLAACLH